MSNLLFLAGATPNISPNSGGLPGLDILSGFASGAEFGALILAIIGTLVGAAIWAVASHSHNSHHAHAGRAAMLVGAFAALAVGAAPGIVSFFFGKGTGVH
ncbi:MAG: hypothetical protein DLM54_00410 [Acidimicrobiales bacterium]|nr:MAG: hypothetical protein DLM54_00410 [Acidimicrobiales bacterium]